MEEARAKDVSMAPQMRRGGRCGGLLALVLLARSAGTQPAEESLVDLDDDGSISLAEFAAGWQREFALRDEDGDGVLSARELLGADADDAELAEHFAKYDLDGDGFVQASEYVEMLHAEFHELDLDGDELLDRFELFQAAAPDGRRLTGDELALMDGQADALLGQLSELGVHDVGELADRALDALHGWLRRSVAPQMVQLSIVSILADQAAAEAAECSRGGLDAYEQSVARFAAGDFSRDERHLIELHAQRTAHGLLAARAVPGQMVSFVKLFIAASLIKMSTGALDARRIAAEASASLEACAEVGALR